MVNFLVAESTQAQDYGVEVFNRMFWGRLSLCPFLFHHQEDPKEPLLVSEPLARTRHCATNIALRATGSPGTSGEHHSKGVVSFNLHSTLCRPTLLQFHMVKIVVFLFGL